MEETVHAPMFFLLSPLISPSGALLLLVSKQMTGWMETQLSVNPIIQMQNPLTRSVSNIECLPRQHLNWSLS